jgi:hypothetical protein
MKPNPKNIPQPIANLVHLRDRSVKAQISRLPALGLRRPIGLARPTSDVRISMLVLEAVVDVVAARAVVSGFTDVDVVCVAEADVAESLAGGCRVVCRGTIGPFLDGGWHRAGRDGDEGENGWNVVHFEGEGGLSS